MSTDNVDKNVPQIVWIPCPHVCRISVHKDLSTFVRNPTQCTQRLHGLGHAVQAKATVYWSIESSLQQIYSVLTETAVQQIRSYHLTKYRSSSRLG